MNKSIFSAVCERIREQVPEIQCVEEDQGQLDVSGQPGVSFPCCLVDMAYPACKTVNRHLQRVSVQIQIRIAFTVQETDRLQTVQKMDVVQKLHRALQSWTGSELFFPMQRAKVLPQIRNGLKIFECTYAMEYHESV